MNRREALAALAALPGITRIERASIRPGDVIVIECDGDVSVETAEQIRKAIESVWPDNKAVVLTCGMRMRIAEAKP